MENIRRSKITDEGSLHKYRTEIPNTVIRGIKSHGLSVHAKWLYVYFKSVCGDSTECYRTTSTIAEESGLSRTMVSTAKRELASKGLIILTKSKNPNRQADHVRIKDIWDANMQEFSVPLANALHEEVDKQAHEDKEVSVPLANTDAHQRSISERSVPLANSSVLLANQRRSQEEDPSEEGTPPSLPPAEPQVERNGVQGHDDFAGIFNQQVKVQAKEVLDYLYEVTGVRHKKATFIEALLRMHYTVADCKLVIDWWQKVWTVNRPEQRDLFDAATPFKKDNFETYLPKAQAWLAGGQETPQTAGVGPNGLVM